MIETSWSTADYLHYIVSCKLLVFKVVDPADKLDTLLSVAEVILCDHDDLLTRLFCHILERTAGADCALSFAECLNDCHISDLRLAVTGFRHMDLCDPLLHLIGRISKLPHHRNYSQFIINIKQRIMDQCVFDLISILFTDN